ncbi:uncharacterized protein EAF02_011380 [Botrytis sinoallii]|uniref:uncharacterized protein n=1 Tax=Botrytis sinoallii TaxID=1463999 RepID=UPI0018FF7693|nr:uncharacterized protein EAF02_011380 [Botrytis sinoallii]KAF7857147.1 hypothetical protein EAF02_011380 [Botrytis sinoallii]
MCNWIYEIGTCWPGHAANQQPAIFPTDRKKQCTAAAIWGEDYFCDDVDTTGILPTDIIVKSKESIRSVKDAWRISEYIWKNSGQILLMRSRVARTVNE